MLTQTSEKILSHRSVADGPSQTIGKYPGDITLQDIISIDSRYAAVSVLALSPNGSEFLGDASVSTLFLEDG